MLAELIQNTAALAEDKARHVLIVLPKSKKLAGVFTGRDALHTLLSRRRMKPEKLAETPASANLASGGLAAWVMLDFSKTAFEQQTSLRKSLQLLLEENPREIAIEVHGSEKQRRGAAELAVYCAWVNGVALPVRKKNNERKPLSKIALYGFEDENGFAIASAKAEGNWLARELTMLPPNELTPGLYRQRIRKIAAEEGWKYQEYDMRRLRKMGAGAFVAVAQGSAEEDAAIVHLRHTGKRAKQSMALVGKGICFDTGGHNLKSAKHMHGMHEDMNGSAVTLGILLAATRANLPVNIDCWLAIAQNQLSPRAYKQNEVVKALNGTTIEIVHTDAEGRMVLSDTLTLAAREKPNVMIDFATLTGSMGVALGSRYSGIFSNRDKLAQQALAAGKASGERVCAFPLDADYEAALESKIADIKQCTLENDADHILAARFLNKFAGDTPWLHMDLSASHCEGGLGAVASDVTGFGVGWGMEMLNLLTRN